MNFFNCNFFFARTRRNRATLDFSFGLPTNKTNIIERMEITLTTEQKIKATLNPVTATGKPAKLDGMPTWSSSTLRLEVADDGMSAYIISTDEPVVDTIVVQADADLGEGVETISGSITVNVVGAKAANLGLTLGEPEPK